MAGNVDHRSCSWLRKIAVFWLFIILGYLGNLLQANSDFDIPGNNCEVISRYKDDPCLNKLNSAPRPHSVTITDFGAVGDGVTLNTHAFHNAIFYIQSFSDKGGGQLYVPAGRWLTGSFNLTNHLTLFLDKDAIILGSEDPKDWPVIEPLPSYGRGRELPGGRYSSLIHGENLVDVIITGDNGTIDGQGAFWWTLYQNNSLQHTRGHLIELINSRDVLISNLTFLNSPFWTIHPVYCSNVFIQNITIFAPHDSPNTDGIDPDSSSNVCIEDCFIRSGGDAVSVKSGWDEYGISYGKPTSGVVIRRVVVAQTGLDGSGISVGSEMSGGIFAVSIEDVSIFSAGVAISLETGVGRGGFMRDISVSNMTIFNVDVAIGITGFSNDHPDGDYDPSAFPIVERITFEGMAASNVSLAGYFLGLPESPFRNISLSNIAFNVTSGIEPSWECSYVEGSSGSVYPLPCPQLQAQSTHVL